MAGQIIQRGERAWLVRLYVGRVQGKRKYDGHTVHGTKKDAQAYLNAKTPQQTIAHCRITAKLGEGGMGEVCMGKVWRAIDTKLGRDVAIKIVPEAFAQGEDRMARFARAAEVLASLNNPNIAAI